MCLKRHKFHYVLSTLVEDWDPKPINRLVGLNYSSLPTLSNRALMAWLTLRWFAAHVYLSPVALVLWIRGR